MDRSHRDGPPSPHRRTPYLDGLAEAALAQHLPVDEVRRPEDAVWPADHAQGLGAPQILALGGRGAQGAGSGRPVDAVAPPGEVHAGLSIPGAGGHQASAPTPPACHTPIHASARSGHAHPSVGEHGTGRLPWVVVRPWPHPDASIQGPVLGLPPCRCLRSTVCPGPSLPGDPRSGASSPSIWVPGPGVWSWPVWPGCRSPTV